MVEASEKVDKESYEWQVGEERRHEIKVALIDTVKDWMPTFDSPQDLGLVLEEELDFDEMTPLDCIHLQARVMKKVLGIMADAVARA